MEIFTKELCKAARALADLTANELATLAKVGPDTIRSFESGRTKSLNRESERAVIEALSAHGVRIVKAEDKVDGAGVAFMPGFPTPKLAVEPDPDPEQS